MVGKKKREAINFIESYTNGARQFERKASSHTLWNLSGETIRSVLKVEITLLPV